MAKAVFLDRDGTIIRDKNFLSSPDGIEILPGVPEALRRLKEKGFMLILITNQSGVGRGFFSSETVDEIHTRLQVILEDAAPDAIYVCPHHPDDGCKCRKPATRLFEEAIKKYSIDPRRSFAVGDKPSDVEAGRRIGCKTVFLGESSGCSSADHCAADFPSAVDWILSHSEA